MSRLVALDLAGGTTFVTWLQRCMDSGDAIMPIDQRLPLPARKRLLDALRPDVIVDSSGEQHHLDGALATMEGDGVVIATSGTTGDPKGVVLTKGAIEASARATSKRIGVDPATDEWLCCLPVAHIGGLSVILRALLSGTKLSIHPGFDQGAVIKSAKDGVTLISLVPTALYQLKENSQLFRTIVLGGSAVPNGLPNNVLTTYGMTETGSGVVYDGFPLEGVEVRTGRADEIELRAPMLFRGYRDGNDPKDDKGWFATGDAGKLDPSGRLTVFGRIAEVIVTGGEKVWPIEVERVLAHLASIREVAVAGVRDEYWGERVVAFVVASNPEVPPVLGDLIEVVREELAPWSAPKDLVVVDELPKTALGKIRRAELVSSRFAAFPR